MVQVRLGGVHWYCENGALAVRATLGGHAVEHAIYKDHIINWLSALMVRAAEAVEAGVAGPVSVNHEYIARAIFTPIGSSSVKLGAIQEQRAVRIFTVMTGRSESVEQLEI